MTTDFTTDPTPTKHCSKCNRDLPATNEYFSRSKRTWDGLHSICKKCDSARSSAYQKANKERVNAKNRDWYGRNPGNNAERKRKDRAANPDKFRERSRRYRESNLEKAKNAIRDWAKRNKDRVDANRKRYKAEKPEAVKAIKQRYRARKAGLPDSFSKAEWQHALDYFGGCCAVCGRPLMGMLHKAHCDHWIPLSDPSCPGSIARNLLPLCGGVDGCNNSKGGKHPDLWLTEKLGKRKAKQVKKKIQAYFDSLA